MAFRQIDYKYREHFIKANLTRDMIEMAMLHTDNNTAAAHFLNVDIKTYRKYAKKFIDHETGKNLYEKHMPDPAKRARRFLEIANRNKKAYTNEAILSNQVPGYPLQRLKERLYKSNLIDKRCNQCGFSEARITDNIYPLLLVKINPKLDDLSMTNLQLVCYNCYFLTYGDMIFKGSKKPKFI